MPRRPGPRCGRPATAHGPARPPAAAPAISCGRGRPGPTLGEPPAARAPMRCPGCGAENRDARRFCGACGAPLAAACAGCGFVNEADEKFCGGCGRALERAPPPVASAPPPAPARPLAGRAAAGDRAVRRPGRLHRLTRELDAEEVHACRSLLQLVDGLIERFGGPSTSTSATASWRCSARRSPMATTRARGARRARDPRRDAGLSRAIGRQLNVHIGIASGQVVASGGAGHEHLQRSPATR